MIANRRAISGSDSAAVGSSITRMRAFWDSALAISTICCCATPSRCDRRARVEIRLQRREHAARLRMRPDAVDRARDPARKLAAEEDILGDVQVGNERELLEDDGDPEPAGVGGRRDAHRLAFEQELAAVGMVGAVQRLDQRRFARAVLAEQHVHFARRGSPATRRPARERRETPSRCRASRAAAAWPSAATLYGPPEGGHRTRSIGCQRRLPRNHESTKLPRYDACSRLVFSWPGVANHTDAQSEARRVRLAGKGRDCHRRERRHRPRHGARPRQRRRTHRRRRAKRGEVERRGA